MNTETKTAQPGTISHGTLKVEDLIVVFVNELRILDSEELGKLFIERAEAKNEIEFEDELDQWFLDCLVDALEVYTPEGHYFGTHIGDGADFGYWPLEPL